MSNAHLEAIESAFAERDEHLSALRSRIERMAEMRSESAAAPEGFERRLDSLENRLEEQERSLRHVLQMMIDYFETGSARSAS